MAKVETKEQIQKAVVAEWMDLAKKIGQKLEKFKKLGDKDAVKVATFLKNYCEKAAEDWAS